MSAGENSETETTRITRKGQVTIPKEFREEYDLEEGDELLWEKGEDGIRVRKATNSAGRGMLLEEDATPADRERVAEEMETEIRERRHSEWQPE